LVKDGRQQSKWYGGGFMDAKETIDYCIDSAVKIGKETYDMVLDFSDESIEHVDKIVKRCKV